MGFITCAISNGADNKLWLKNWGRIIRFDPSTDNVTEALQKLGGARVILATAPSGKAITPLIDGLGGNGELVIVGASMDPIQLGALQLIGKESLSQVGLLELPSIQRKPCNFVLKQASEP